MSEYKRPQPVLNEYTEPFWKATKEHRLVAQKCKECGHIWHPPSPVCDQCLSFNYEWINLSGKGKVWSYVVYHRPFTYQSFKDAIPYNVTYVKLDEGLGFTTNLVGIANEDIKIGMCVEVSFEDCTEELTLPKFRPLK